MVAMHSVSRDLGSVWSVQIRLVFFDLGAVVFALSRWIEFAGAAYWTHPPSRLTLPLQFSIAHCEVRKISDKGKVMNRRDMLKLSSYAVAAATSPAIAEVPLAETSKPGVKSVACWDY